MSGFPIGSEGVECLANSTMQWEPNNQLEVLELEACQIELSGSFPAMRVLGSGQNLLILVLSGNNMKGLFVKLNNDQERNLTNPTILNIV